jgi:hypothetical protein
LDSNILVKFFYFFKLKWCIQFIMISLNNEIDYDFIK